MPRPRRRPWACRTAQAKAAKDLRQAESLLDILLTDRPEDLLPAWEALKGRAAAARQVQKATERLPEGLRQRLFAALPALSRSAPI